MATEVLMPRLGESVVEGTISRWLVREGDQVEKLQPILEISTDKVDTEVPAPASGTVLKLYFGEGETLPTGTVLAVIGQPGEAVPSRPQPSQAVQAARQPLAPTASVARGKPAVEEPSRSAVGRVSPVVARIAQEHNVDLRQVRGTGRGGRITKKDILAYIEARQQAEAQEAAVAQVEAPEARAPEEVPAIAEAVLAAATPPVAREAARPAAEDELVPLSRRQRLMAEHMVASKRTSPHVTTVMEADMSAVVAHRKAYKARFAQQGVDLTFMPYFIQATIAGLRAVPEVNAAWQENGILLKRRFHIGMAVATAEGLIVPVIHDADNLSLLGLARQVNELARRARAGQLTPDEVHGATFTITNHGAGGSLLGTPIINQPNVAILGVGLIQKRPVVISRGDALEPSSDDYLAIRPMVYLSLTFDHRVLDGASADRFLMSVKQTLERWPGPSE